MVMMIMIVTIVVINRHLNHNNDNNKNNVFLLLPLAITSTIVIHPNRLIRYSLPYEKYDMFQTKCQTGNFINKNDGLGGCIFSSAEHDD